VENNTFSCRLDTQKWPLASRTGETSNRVKNLSTLESKIMKKTICG